MLFHVHVYKVVGKAEMDVEAEDVKDMEDVIRRAADHLDFNDKDLDEEMPKRVMIRYNVLDPVTMKEKKLTKED